MKKLVMLAALAGTACTRSNDSLTLSARVGAANGQKLSTASGGAQVANGIDVTRVRVVIRHLRLEREDDKTDTKIAEGPLLLDVSGTNLGGALVELVTNNVPAGTYDKLKLDIHVIDAAPASQSGFKDLVDRAVSVLIEGKLDKQLSANCTPDTQDPTQCSFTFGSALEAELEQEGRFQLGGPANNITLNIDASKWFQAADGSVLIPLDPGAQSAIEANIKASFSAFEDDNEDGEADDGEHNDGGHDDGEHPDGGDDGERDAGIP